MHLTLEQAAARLGKSVRQTRYLIKIGRLPAKKFAGVWVVDSADLPLSAGQVEALDRRERQLRSAVEEALEIPEKSDRAPRYSVRDLKAFQIALPLFRSGVERLGAEHPAVAALRRIRSLPPPKDPHPRPLSHTHSPHAGEGRPHPKPSRMHLSRECGGGISGSPSPGRVCACGRGG